MSDKANLERIPVWCERYGTFLGVVEMNPKTTDEVFFARPKIELGFLGSPNLKIIENANGQSPIEDRKAKISVFIVQGCDSLHNWTVGTTKDREAFL